MTGCGAGGPPTPSNAELALERSQFLLVTRGLRAVEGSVRHEVGTSRGAWPSIADGLPQTFPASLRAAVSRASASAKALTEPRFMTQADKLTGPAAGLAGLYESYSRLAERGWRLTETTIDAIEGGTPTVARFERTNSPLYIDAVYDSHFDLSLMGEHLESGYTQLGGPAGFGGKLTQREVDALARAYSIPSVRLEPHTGPGVEVG